MTIVNDVKKEIDSIKKNLCFSSKKISFSDYKIEIDSDIAKRERNDFFTIKILEKQQNWVVTIINCKNILLEAL